MLAFYEILQVEQVQCFMMSIMILRWIAEILYKVLDRYKIIRYNKYIAGIQGIRKSHKLYAEVSSTSSASKFKETYE